MAHSLAADVERPVDLRLPSFVQAVKIDASPFFFGDDKQLGDSSGSAVLFWYFDIFDRPFLAGQLLPTSDR